ncbi:MAG TPA: ABC transporter permease subunit [Thermoanaerobacterales bacterium]|nr:ABC transporter permease subunit [Thermoanaerobacterales bacterium]
MCLKILPFNKTLLKKDWKMTKWVAWLVAIVLFFAVTLGVINTYNNYQRTLKETEEHPEHYRKRVVDIDEDREYYEDFDIEEYKISLIDALDDGFKRLSGTEVFLIVFVPIAVATLLFGEEKRRKTFEVLSTMPFTRFEIFFNKVIIAFVNVFVPFLINALIMIVALGFSKGLREFYSTGLVMYWLGTNSFRLFVMLSFSLLFATLTGTSISQAVLTLIFFIFPIGFTLLLGMNMSVWGYGVYVIEEFLDKFGSYTLPAVLDRMEYIPIAYHIICGIIMLIGAKLLFDRNKLERSGETLEFESIETFFKVGVAVCTSLLTGVLFTGFGEGIMYSSGNTYTILGYIIGIALGWLAASYSIKLNRAKG